MQEYPYLVKSVEPHRILGQGHIMIYRRKMQQRGESDRGGIYWIGRGRTKIGKVILAFVYISNI